MKTCSLKTIEQALNSASTWLALAGAVALLAMLAITCANIILRPLGESIRGTVEISGYLCALGVGLGMPAAQMYGAHISAGLWEKSLPKPLITLQRLLVNFLCAAALILAAQELFGVAGYALDMDEVIEGFSFTYAPMAFGFALALLLHAAFFVLYGIRLFSPTKEVRS